MNKTMNKGFFKKTTLLFPKINELFSFRKKHLLKLKLSNE